MSGGRGGGADGLWWGLVRILIALYPAGLRRELRASLERDFRQLLEEARRRGGVGAVHRRALRELLDLVRNLPSAWREALGRPDRPGEPSPRSTLSGGAPWTGLGAELRQAARALRRRPGYALAVAVTLGVAVGANSAVFALVDGILLEPLPYPDPDALVYMDESYRGDQEMSVSYLNYRDWERMSRSWEELGARTSWSYTLTGEGDARRVPAMLVSHDLPAVLGVAPALGRFFTEEEERRRDRVVVLSHGLWTSRFAGDRAVLGRALTLDGEAYLVVGVMPREAAFPLDGADLFAPLTRVGEDELTDRSQHPGISVVGRLAAGVTMEDAREDMERVAAILAERYPESNRESGVRLSSLHQRAVGDADTVLLLLQGTVLLVLLIAVANVANLGVVRALSAAGDAGIRMALGAGGSRVVRPVLLETLLLGLLGGLLGLALAAGVVEVSKHALAGDLPRLAGVTLDVTVLLATLGVIVSSVALAGLLPALRSARVAPAETLRAGGGERGGSRPSERARNALIVGEVALTFVVLAGAALMLRSTMNILDAELGFDPEGVVAASVPLESGYPTVEARAGFYRRLLDRVEDIPGVETAAGVSPLPLGPGGWQTSISGEGLEQVDRDGLRTEAAEVTPGYFETMRIPLLAGRSFQGRETMDDPVAIVDETLAERLWPGEDPIGRSFRLRYSDDPPYRVVGVVGHVKNYGAARDSRVQVYFPYTQDVYSLSLVARTDGDEGAFVQELRSVVAEMDPTVPVTDIRRMQELEADTRRAETLTVRVLLLFAGLSLLLALFGLYGLIAYSVSLRTREIGIRLALGARSVRVTRMVLQEGATVILAGVAVGVLGALAMTRALSDLLFGVAPVDPLAMGGAATALVVLGMAAVLLPALRAARIQPGEILRNE